MITSRDSWPRKGLEKENVGATSVVTSREYN